MTNSSTRRRFNIPKKNTARASILLREAVEAGVIVVRNPEIGRRHRAYLPFWAVGE